MFPPGEKPLQSGNLSIALCAEAQRITLLKNFSTLLFIVSASEKSLVAFTALEKERRK